MCPATSTPKASDLPDPSLPATSAHAAFESWAAGAVSRKRMHLCPRSVKQYRSTWFNWVAWLPPHTPWEKAAPEQVSAYLHQLSASATARQTQPNSSRRPASTVTQRRYWRMLRDIYAHAVVMAWCEANPCAQATEIPASEAMASMILPAWALRQLQDGILHQASRQAVRKWQDVRNDALLLLLLHTGAKTGELVSLRVDQALKIRTEKHGEQWAIQIDGEKDCQQRHITLDEPRAGAALAQWLRVRQHVPRKSPWLFFGAKSHVIDGKRELSPLSSKTIFILVAGALKAHLPPNTFEGMLSHAGAEAIRNSVLARWLEAGLGQEEVMRRAGVAEIRAVVRLDRKDVT
ncbi:hypothetical protein Rfer_4383 (plasmid) [Rhodoferax ferrireducens T118]|uniref:Tyr recombinase domain-containing protein n=1 Tax=Albidiferax ferrireducens (strain ATCC BAA-621 / DSM 15236 / T118) TaxID=338969 RepID=Q21Q76_ALBFT|nr:tyrosine-type recombinase/integrase [Rhodoferax ferrireducens]ABD72069.1 hypothetical protein Rfer_4383 [Rhodoferax ferrireducens T118]